MPHETAAVSVQVQFCRHHAPCHFMQSHIRKVYGCLAVTCHLHFWQNDQDLLRATAHRGGCTLRASLSSTFLQTLPDLVTPLKGTLYLRAAVHRRGQRPPKGSGTNHTPSIAFRHLPPNSARFSYATEGHSLSPRSCPPTRSAPSERFGY